ncbi:hypothetical protein J6590_079104 [Homalodisca vitripennis]|nr:hypothetical protein J6590_079104 [Homalodisca vitripennis]
MTALLNENPVAHKIVKMTMSLPLLPHDAIPAGMRAIRQHALRNGLAEEMERFLLYVEETWIQVFRQRRRTNNHQESFNKTLITRMRHPHPNVWVFIGEYTVLQFLQRASHVVMDAVVNPNDDDPDDGVAHPPPPSPIGIPLLLEDPVEPIAESRRRRRAPEDPIIENPQEVLGRGRRLVRGDVRGRSRARGRGRPRGRGLARGRDRGLVQGDQNEYQPHPQETIDDQFHRLQGIHVDDYETVADPGEATCSTCLVNVRTYMMESCSNILFCGPCVRFHRQGMRNEAGVLINYVIDLRDKK